MSDQTESAVEPSVLGAMWRYRILVALLAVAFGAIGWWYGNSNVEWAAEAVVSVQDPRATNLSQGIFAEVQPERYVRDQAAILESRLVAKQASLILAEQDPPIDVSTDAIVGGLVISASADRDVITLSYTDPNPRGAIGVVNAIVAAYQDVRKEAARSTFAEALDTIDSSVGERREELAALREEILARTEADPVRQEIVEDLADSVGYLLALDPPDRNATAEEISRSSAVFNELRLRIETLRAALGQQTTDVELEALVDRQTEVAQRLSDLESRRESLAVDAELSGTGVVFSSPAEVATPTGFTIFLILGVLLGMITAGIIAYSLARRHRSFSDRAEPEKILGVSLITDVPHFSSERLKTDLPVVDARGSAAAEAFRFAAGGISLQQIQRGGSGAVSFTTLVVTSANVFDGKTVVTANTAFALAREGSRVLVIDADFSAERLTRLLLGNDLGRMGMTDVAAGTVPLTEAVLRVARDGVSSFDVLGRGSVDMSASDFFLSPGAAKLFSSAAASYDLVLIDTPPLLRVAYATAIARLADRVMLVVSHHTDIAAASELRHRLDVIDTPLIGYVYNMAPLRPEMTLTLGSMLNTQGIPNSSPSQPTL